MIVNGKQLVDLRRVLLCKPIICIPMMIPKPNSRLVTKAYRLFYILDGVLDSLSELFEDAPVMLRVRATLHRLLNKGKEPPLHVIDP